MDLGNHFTFGKSTKKTKNWMYMLMGVKGLKGLKCKRLIVWVENYLSVP